LDCSHGDFGSDATKHDCTVQVQSKELIQTLRITTRIFWHISSEHNSAMAQPKSLSNTFDQIRIALELAYLALPLLIYILFFLVVVSDKEPTQLWHKPEWMFIALLYVTESLRDSVQMYGNERGAGTGALQASLILNILLFVVTAVVLFAVLGAYEGAFKPTPNLYVVQWGCLVGSFLICWQRKMQKHTHERRAQAKITNEALRP
jgi:hypothetical protein